MIALVADAQPGTLESFDEVIDARSPSEFAEDHLRGAVNLPVLDDEERARVGTLYVQDDPFRARRLGAALVSRNIARHLEGPLAGRGGGWRPLVYCWRGGQRSHAFATVLSQVGWRTAVLSGGYRTYRRGVVAGLYEPGPIPSLMLLGGGTGVGKTELLTRLAADGEQVIDLEALAAHRGSLFGAVAASRQPSQKLFESRLYAILSTLDTTRPTLVEAESSKLGEIVLPPRLWRAMVDAPVIELTASRDVRVRRLVGAYGGENRERTDLAEALDRLPRHIGRETREAWRGLLTGGEFGVLVGQLLEAHYDPAYRRSAGRGARPLLGTVGTGDGSRLDLELAADRVRELIAAHREQG